MITFIKKPVGKLNLDGSTEGIPKNSPPANIGMPTPQFHEQLAALVNKKVPLEKALLAIEKHPDITDKVKAKEMADAVYKILEDTKDQTKQS